MQVIEAPLCVTREFCWAYLPFQMGKVLWCPLLSPTGEKSHSSHSFWILWGVWPRAQTSSEDCSFSVRVVSLPDYVATETKPFYALKIRFFFFCGHMIFSLLNLSREAHRAWEQPRDTTLSLMLQITMFLRLWDGKKLVLFYKKLVVTVLLTPSLNHTHMNDSICDPEDHWNLSVF